MPPRSLSAFLRAARAALTAPGPRPLTFVVGNESADLDSLGSAVLLAYLRSHTPPHTLHIPLCHLPRADLDLRPELGVALGEALGEEEGGAPDDAPTAADLITLSELPDRLDARDTRWLLVDHNALTGDLAERFASQVVGCIDHHVDEGVVPVPDAGWPRIIERAGSCASLVVDACQGVWRDLAQRHPDAPTDRVLARLALSPILVDTANLTSASKTEDVDRRAVEFASEAFFADGDDGDRRTALYDSLLHRKNDIAAWTYDMLLRKDYKQWTEGACTLGMASVVQGLDFLLAHNGPRETLSEAVHAFAQQRGLDLLAVMTVQFDAGTRTGTMARQLVVWAFNADAVRVAQAFADANRDRLGLEPWTDTAGQPLFAADDDAAAWHRCWTQARTECSRKQVAPYLREAMRC